MHVTVGQAQQQCSGRGGCRSALIGSYFSTASLPPLPPVDHTALLQQAAAGWQPTSQANTPAPSTSQPPATPARPLLPQLRPALQSVVSGRTLGQGAADAAVADAASPVPAHMLARRSLGRAASAPQGALMTISAASGTSEPAPGAVLHMPVTCCFADVHLPTAGARCM